MHEGGRLVTNQYIQNLEGRLLTLIETLGFNETREQAIKGIVRQHVWDIVPYWDELWIYGEDVPFLHDQCEKRRSDMTTVKGSGIAHG